MSTNKRCVSSLWCKEKMFLASKYKLCLRALSWVLKGLCVKVYVCMNHFSFERFVTWRENETIPKLLDNLFKATSCSNPYSEIWRPPNVQHNCRKFTTQVFCNSSSDAMWRYVQTTNKARSRSKRARSVGKCVTHSCNLNQRHVMLTPFNSFNMPTTSGVHRLYEGQGRPVVETGLAWVILWSSTIAGATWLNSAQQNR